MAEFIAVILITILAVISPGADFAIVTKNSYLYGRKIGVFTSLGISLGVLVHVTYTLVAVAFVMTYTPQILNIVKYIGALYLIYIGYKTFTQKPVLDSAALNSIGTLQAIKSFFTNALNPKTTLFVISTYTQIVSLTTPKTILLAYGFFMSFAHFVWFSLVAVLFSSILLRQKMLAKQVQINRVIGSILCVLGVILLFTKFQ
ncbi:LysE family translocator [Acinetobacter baumannii]|uniref:LysE family translocator n=1 Tax=Acinetobacter baumannii TaxID=470 RepID=UPI0004535FC3|nr:LysE family translocator [Acinetobacter baumannii]KCY66536.1 lysE type translocator family protein [Acinetobacter baumannii 1288284]EKV2136693.1 LysE family translocator [Acinetobacter baumannii]EKV2141009.1 LysE family translocator [Acinetobacter baumannii]EKW2955167.1 LysE family translocator [Acinetobacter baumannii]EKW3172630.1 LysE family translocator [Acinetobacter baumannii]